MTSNRCSSLSLGTVAAAGFAGTLLFALSVAMILVTSPAEAASAPRAWTGPDRGNVANRCIDDVQDALRRIDGGKTDASRFEWDPNHGFRVRSHAQGVARFEGLGDENWFAVSRGGSKNSERILEFVHFDGISTCGGPLASSPVVNSRKGRNVLSFDLGGSDSHHAGGIQAVGKYLFVPSDSSAGARVDVIDASSLSRGLQPLQVTSFNPGEFGERPDVAPSAHYAAAVRLEDGKYLAMVAKDSRDRLKTDKDHRAWFYRTRRDHLEGAEWEYLGHWDFAGIRERKAWQSANLIAQCDGKVYLVMMRPGRAKKNYLDVFEVHSTAGGTPKPSKVMQRRIFKRRRSGRCTFNAGGGLHVGPSGRDFSVYCTEKADLFHMQIDEYRDRDTEHVCPPAITITSPTRGTALSSSYLVRLRATAKDHLTGADLQVAWSSDLQGPIGHGNPLEVRFVPGNHTLRACTFDSAGTHACDRISVSVLDEAPIVNLLEPANHAALFASEPIRLLASSYDAIEPGFVLPDHGIAWSSSNDGPLGTGHDLRVFLSEGTHVIRVVGTDSSGNRAEDFISLTVLPVGPDLPPHVEITNPNRDLEIIGWDGFDPMKRLYYVDVQLGGFASDPEDGQLKTFSLIWKVDQEIIPPRALGRRVRLYGDSCFGATLRIELGATDSAGNRSTAVRRIRISSLC